jgi:hypothetical protein
MIRALLKLPLKAYAGEGKQAQGGKGEIVPTYTPPHHVKVHQLYIPGLFVRGDRPRQQLYQQVFSLVTIESLMK